MRSLSQSELSDLRAAFARMYPTAGGHPSYTELLAFHGRSFPSGVHFLAWNRAYLLQFEQLLADYDAGPLPVWDWTADGGSIPEAFAATSEDNPLASGPIDGPGREFLPDDVPSFTTRNPSAEASPPSAEEVAGILALTEWSAFQEALESFNGTVHVWVGGSMAQVMTSAYDPLFWAHRAMVDRIWREWQLRHPDSGPPKSLLDTTPPGFAYTVGELLDTEELGYDYERLILGRETRALLESGAANDRPGGLGALGFRPYAAAFAELIAAPGTRPPLTIGIFASWGMGKSTLLEGIVDEIERGQGAKAPEARGGRTLDSGSPYVHVVRFNAWDYAKDEAIWPALARATMEQIYEQVPWPWWRRLPQVFRRNLAREWRRNHGRIVVSAALLVLIAVIAVTQLDFAAKAIATGLVGLGVVGLLKVATDTVSNPASRWVGQLVQGSTYGERLSHIDEIRDDLTFLVDRLEQHAEVDRRVLVLIDDLDRCEPDKTVEVLHAINRLLDFPSFIVCLGADAGVVTAAIERHYEGLFGEAGTSGFQYLDKIVQIPFRIPEPDEEALSEFLEELLPVAEAGLVEHREEEVALAPDANGDGRATGGGASEYRVQRMTLEEAAPLGQRVPFRREELDAFDRAVPYLRANPRHVKRLVNLYRLVRTLAEWRSREPGGDPEAELVLGNPEGAIRWLVASMQWPYTTSGMLATQRRIERLRAAGYADAIERPEGNPLPWLLERSTLSGDNQARFDDEIEQLERLLADTTISWEELAAIRGYTANFNPAVEEQLRAEWLRGAPTPSRS